MNGVLQPLGDPVPCKRDEDDQTNHFGRRAPTGTGSARAGRVAAATRGLVLDVDADEGDGEPGAERDGAEAADGGDEKDMTETAGDVHGLLQHDHREGDARDPGHEADDAEDAEDDKHHGCRVVVFDEVVDGGAEGEDDVQDARDPDELLGEGAGGEEVAPGQDQGDNEHEDEEDEGVGVQGEGVAAVVDATAGEGFVAAVAGDRKAGDGRETEEGYNELFSSISGGFERV